MTGSAVELTTTVVDDLGQVSRSEWDRVAEDSGLYLSHGWLRAVHHDSGVTAFYVLVRRGAELVGALPIFDVAAEGNAFYAPGRHHSALTGSGHWLLAGSRRGYRGGVLLTGDAESRQSHSRRAVGDRPADRRRARRPRPGLDVRPHLGRRTPAGSRRLDRLRHRRREPRRGELGRLPGRAGQSPPQRHPTGATPVRPGRLPRRRAAPGGLLEGARRPGGERAAQVRARHHRGTDAPGTRRPAAVPRRPERGVHRAPGRRARRRRAGVPVRRDAVRPDGRVRLRRPRRRLRVLQPRVLPAGRVPGAARPAPRAPRHRGGRREGRTRRAVIIRCGRWRCRWTGPSCSRPTRPRPIGGAGPTGTTRPYCPRPDWDVPW